MKPLTVFPICLAILAVAAAWVEAKEEIPRMNVLFIAVDDLRPELGCYGRADIKSPNIDKLAAAGMFFEQAYCQQAVCAPSRASLLTGLRPDSTRIYDLNHPVRKNLPDVLSLPQYFKQHGYTDIPNSGPLTKEKALELIHGYCAAVSHVDALIGQVVDALDASGVRKNTAIILWGDHGWKLSDYGA